MPNIHTFTQLNERLDVTIASLSANTISRNDAVDMHEDLLVLQQKLSTLQTYVEARMQGENVHAFCRPVVTETTSTDIDPYAVDEHISTTWPDGRHVEWIGGQCIVSSVS